MMGQMVDNHFLRSQGLADEGGFAVDIHRAKTATAVAASIAEGQAAVDVFIDVKDSIQNGHSFLKRNQMGFPTRSLIFFRVETNEGQADGAVFFHESIP